MNRTNCLAITIFLAAVIVYALVQWLEPDAEESRAYIEELSPEFIAEHLTSDIFSAEGQLTYVIKADRMEHYEDLMLTRFEQPNYLLYPKNNRLPWKMSAQEATLYDNNRVILKNNVKLISTDPTSIIQEIHGKNLELNLTLNTVSSEHKILILGQGFTVHGSGLNVDLNTTQMTLTDHVKTIYNKKNS